MAIIQTIRDKYAKLAGGVIVLALVGFILMDYGKGGGPSQSTTVGEINGEEIDYTDYEAAIRQQEEQFKMQNPGASIDDQTQAQIRDQVWQQMVNTALMNDIQERLGIQVTEAELNDLLTGPRPDPTVRQAFTNPQTGQFNPQEVAASIAQMKKDPQAAAQWQAFEQDLLKRRAESKFNALVAGAIYTPKFVLDDQYKMRNSTASIDFVKLPYTLVADDQVKTTDEEIKKYMEQHRARFEVKEPSRSVEYVSFNVVPSSEDSTVVRGTLEQLKAELETTTDLETFVNRNSETQIPVNYYTAEQLKTIPNAAELQTAAVGTVVGPFYDGQGFAIAKVADKKSFPDSVKVRHILVKTADQGAQVLDDAAAKSRIDSVVAAVNAGVPFDTLVQLYSDDAGSLATGGVYDFALVQKPGISKEFGDFAFEGRSGQSKVVKVENPSYAGYHYIEILSQGTPAPVTKVAFVSKSLNANNTTYNAIYSEATQFAANARTAADFDKTVKEKGLMPGFADNLNENSFLVGNLGSSRELVKWVYGAKEGDVSPIFTIGNQFVVAKLKGIMNAGLAPINEQTRPQLTALVQRAKKAKILLDRSKGKANLQAIAEAEQQQVGHADSINFVQSFVPGLGLEPKVAGFAYNPNLKINTLSPGIEGNDGVYYINLTARTFAAESTDRNYNIERQMLEMNMRNSGPSMILNAIREASTVKDTRSEVY